MICILSEHQNSTSHLIKGQIQADLNYLSDLKPNLELEKWPQSWPPPPWSSSWPHSTAHTPCQPWSQASYLQFSLSVSVWSWYISIGWSSVCLMKLRVVSMVTSVEAWNLAQPTSTSYLYTVSLKVVFINVKMHFYTDRTLLWQGLSL